MRRRDGNTQALITKIMKEVRDDDLYTFSDLGKG